jgi:hypothetical protein
MHRATPLSESSFRAIAHSNTPAVVAEDAAPRDSCYRGKWTEALYLPAPISILNSVALRRIAYSSRRFD